jgi:2',3'-cyclic-nucleotide 2'-phosphodiesterase (5'-nucleotidase family)
VAANLADSADGARPDWAVPYRLVQVGGRRVAVVGLSGGDLAGVPDGYAAGLALRAPEAAVRDAVALARTENPAFVVVVTSGDPRPVAAALPPAGADAVVGASDAGAVDTLVNGIPVLAGTDGGAAVARVDLVRTVVGDRTWRFAVDPVVAGRVAGDTAVAAVLARYAPLADSAAAKVVADAKLPIVRRSPGASLGDLVADAWRTAFRAPVALVADTALHGDLPAGPLTLGAVQELLGRGSLIGLRRWTGAELKAELEGVLASGAPVSSVSGISVRYDPRAAVGRRVRDVRFPDGSRLRDRDTYRVVTAVPPGTPGARRAVGALILYLRALPQPVEAPGQPRFLPRS